jgi:hypothetical protein
VRARTGILSAGVVAGLMGFAGAARADAAPSNSESQAEEPNRPDRWYGWQILLSDLTVAGWLSGSIVGQVGSPWPLVIGATTYVSVPPVVHGFHHNGLGLGVSIGMRVTLPIVAGFAAVGLAHQAIAECQAHEGLLCGLDDFAYGWLAGMGMASVIGASVLAWDRRPAHPSDSPIAGTGSPAILPSVTVARDVDRRWTPMLAVGGAF